MFTILMHLKNRYLSQRAQGMVEYALILAFVVLIAAALTNAGGIKEGIEAVFNKVTEQLSKATATGSK